MYNYDSKCLYYTMPTIPRYQMSRLIIFWGEARARMYPANVYTEDSLCLSWIMKSMTAETWLQKFHYFFPPQALHLSPLPPRLLRLHSSRHLPPGPPRPRSLLTELLYGRLWDLFTGLGLGQSALDNKEDTDFWLSGHLPSACLMINCVYLQLKLYIILTSLSL